VAGQAAVQGADQAVAQGAQRLVVRGAAGAVGVPGSAAPPGEADSATNAHWMQALASRSLRATLAATTVLVPEVRVTGAVPAYALRPLAVA
jgi:hypothetical protein